MHKIGNNKIVKRRTCCTSFIVEIRVRTSKTLTSGELSNYGSVSRSSYRANAVGSGRRAVSESAPRVGGFAVRGKPPALEALLCHSPFTPLIFCAIFSGLAAIFS